MTDKSHDRFQLERLAFFSDAVFAIAITLLVIEVRIPHLDEFTDRAVANALLGLIPKYIGFVVSFFVIGRFWLGHHRVFGLLDRCDDGLVGRNLVLLMAIAFGPFPTALISEFAGARTAVAVYTGWLVLAGLLSRRVTVYAVKTPALWSAAADAATFTRYSRGAWTPILIGLAALTLGMVMPVLALIPLVSSPLIIALFNRWYVERRHD